MAGLTNLNPFVIINCADSTSTSSQGLVFDDKKLTVAQGALTLASLNMANFFQPCSTYLMQEFTLGSLDTTYIEPANQGPPLMIILYAIFPNNVTEDVKWLEWSCPPVSASPSGQAMKMGQLMILSGATGNTWDLSGAGGLELYNPQSFDIGLKVLIIS